MKGRQGRLGSTLRCNNWAKTIAESDLMYSYNLSSTFSFESVVLSHIFWSQVLVVLFLESLSISASMWPYGATPLTRPSIKMMMMMPMVVVMVRFPIWQSVMNNDFSLIAKSFDRWHPAPVVQSIPYRKPLPALVRCCVGGRGWGTPSRRKRVPRPSVQPS